jgi:hypothetical protein
MACQYELKKGTLENVNSYLRLSKIRCSGDKYVEFIGQKFDMAWTIAEAKKHMFHLFENPEVTNYINKAKWQFPLMGFFIFSCRKILYLMLSKQLSTITWKQLRLIK